MADTLQTFHPFGRLPLEVQFKIWKESIKQAPRRVFEIQNHDPSFDTFDRRKYNRLFNGGRIEIADIALYERSVELQRPLLGVDRTSRKENLRYYRHTKFLNAHVYMNMEVDIMYFGNFMLESLLFLDIIALPDPDPFWSEVQHLALGMHEVQRILTDEDMAIPSWPGCIEDLQEFPALKTCTIVLDAIEVRPEWPPKINGAITFGKPSEACRGPGPESLTIPDIMELNKQWMMYFRKQWKRVRLDEPRWNVPGLAIKSISRGGILQLPDWILAIARGLPSWIIGCELAKLKAQRELGNLDPGELDDESCDSDDEV